jgi:sulfur relay protein TusB/DsrH
MNAKSSDSSSCLHLVLGPDAEALAACSAHFHAGDDVMFLDAGVMQLFERSTKTESAFDKPAYFLESDLEARGLAGPARNRGVRMAHESDFTRLLRQHDHCLSWK